MSTTETQPTRRSIKVLPKELAEKIAAGEVVERPASVIKELVENSLDAGSTHIRVELEDGGKKRISVLDDGHGIAEDELPLALERHATSKIQELDDLWNLHTMGFRGEALPSVAAISRFTIETRTQDSPKGRKLYLEGGKVVKDEPVGPQSLLKNQGTLIAVEDLFFNVPARLKFQKTKSGESAYVRELLERIALCNPKTAFTFFSDGRKNLDLPAAKDEATRVAKVLEVEPADLEHFESHFEDISVHGWLDRNSRAPNSRHVFLSVNGRMVRDKLLQQAVLVALRSRMMEGEYPKIYLAVGVPPGDVDVNVHPAKSEVRFRKPRDVFQVIHGALERLAKAPTKAFYDVDLPNSVNSDREDTPPTLLQSATKPSAPTQEQHALSIEDRVTYRTKDYVGVNIGGMTVAFEPTKKTESVTASATGTETADRSPSPVNNQPPTEPVTETAQHKPTAPGFHRLHYIGQLKNTYLLFQDSTGLVVIDQHAAHERINYERIKADFLKNGLKAQPLLISAVVKCRADDVAIALDHTDAFAKLGFEFEAFGDAALIVRSAPEGLEPDRASELFKALLEELRDSDTAELLASDPSKISAKVERIIATHACHSSVRAGQSLSPREAQELSYQMDETESSLNCPHGRPASIRLSFSQIEGLFKRG